MVIEVIQATKQRELSHAFRIRSIVFVEEQHVPAIEEIDVLDEHTPLYVAYVAGEPVATARLIVVDDELVKVGRVAVLKQHRGQGIGQEMMRQLMTIIKDEMKQTKVKLGAQCQVIPFYETLGFEAYGPVFLDANIEHRDMVCQIIR